MPIIGVAGDDWTLDHLRRHARKCVVDAGIDIDEAVFERFAARLSYVPGDFADETTYAKLKQAMGASVFPTFYLEVPPACSRWWSRACTASA